MEYQERDHLRKLLWAIGFSQDPFNDSVKARHDLYDFVLESIYQGATDETPSVIVELPGEQGFVRQLTTKRLAEIHDALRAAFDQLADHSSFDWTLRKPRRASKVYDRSMTFAWRAYFPHLRFSQDVQFPADPLDRAMIALGLHLEHSGLTGEQIRRCPECGTVFIRERKPQMGRMQYCTLLCSRNAANRSYLARLAEKKHPSAARKKRSS